MNHRDNRYFFLVNFSQEDSSTAHFGTRAGRIGRNASDLKDIGRQPRTRKMAALRMVCRHPDAIRRMQCKKRPENCGPLFMEMKAYKKINQSTENKASILFLALATLAETHFLCKP